MMRTMYDSTVADTIPVWADLVAGYIDGPYVWTTAEWARSPAAAHVQISVTASLKQGDVIDMETGDATPAEAAAWIRARKADGYERPTVYCSLSNVHAIRQATGSLILGKDYDIWVGSWTPAFPHQVIAPGPGLPAACPAVQYTNLAIPGYDLSAVFDAGWPHRKAPAPVAVPSKAEAEAAVRVLAGYVA